MKSDTYSIRSRPLMETVGRKLISRALTGSLVAGTLVRPAKYPHRRLLRCVASLSTPQSPSSVALVGRTRLPALCASRGGSSGRSGEGVGGGMVAMGLGAGWVFCAASGGGNMSSTYQF